MGQTGPGFGAKVLEKNGEMFESILRYSFILYLNLKPCG